ncbi:unnamed protein product [Cylicocyclus nassatus]|uniref:Uncharacterized protein n=1 Tax=Cylicocyclus nassatus TaxID=53992 RepID=A0AA36HB65_CYLNA|nr:unnamed protein product [Cylicocyclus nassatus]
MISAALNIEQENKETKLQQANAQHTDMKFIVLFALAAWTTCEPLLTPKMLLTTKVKQLVTAFLSDEQLSRAIDIAALDIHNGKLVDEVMTDLHSYFTDSLDDTQHRVINNAYENMSKDLGEEGAQNVFERAKKIVSYAVSPAVEIVRVEGVTPDLSYLSMARQLTPNFVRTVAALVKDTLTPAEWNSARTHFGPMLQMLDNDVQQSWNPLPVTIP